MYIPSQRWSVVLCTLNWIFWSNLTILFNKWVLESTPFHYPILLTTWHLLFATLATQLLFRTSILASLSTKSSIKMTPHLYMSKIAPIGVLYSGSLACSNSAYMFLNVGFIQVLKATGPVITLLTSALYGVTSLTIPKLVNVAFITASVGLTVASEIQFSWVGVVVQIGSLVCDALRLVALQVLTCSNTSMTSRTRVSDEDGRSTSADEETGILNSSSRASIGSGRTGNEEFDREKDSGLGKMNPLLSLYYTAPICALMNGVLAWRAEIYPLYSSTNTQTEPTSTSTSSLSPNSSLLDIILSTGPVTLLANATVGFMLNIAVFTLIGKTSGLTMTLVSVPKNILLIFASAVVWGTRVSLLQGVGYAGALGGLVVYAGGGGYILKVLRGWGGYEVLGKGKGRV